MIKQITRQQLGEDICNTLEQIKAKFQYKNGNYGSGVDGFHNFRETANRVCGTEEAMFTVLMVYMDKHLVALAKNGLADPEFEDRLQDIIVYSAIAAAMKRNVQE